MLWKQDSGQILTNKKKKINSLKVKKRRFYTKLQKQIQAKVFIYIYICIVIWLTDTDHIGQLPRV